MNIQLGKDNKVNPKPGSPVAFEYYKDGRAWSADLLFDNGDRWVGHQYKYKTKTRLLDTLVDLTGCMAHIDTVIRKK